MAVRLGPVPPINLSNKMPRLTVLLTRCDICGSRATAIRLVKVNFRSQKGATIPLTDQHPKLVYHGEVSVLHPPFRVEKYSLQMTYQNEKHENYLIVSGFRNAGLPSAYPMISSRTKRT